MRTVVVRRRTVFIGMALAGALTVAGVVATADGASSPKPGQFCKNVNATAKYNGATLKCVPSKSKHWVITVPAPAKTVVRTATVTKAAVTRTETVTTTKTEAPVTKTETATVTIPAATGIPLPLPPQTLGHPEVLTITATGGGGNCRYFINAAMGETPVTTVDSLIVRFHVKATNTWVPPWGGDEGVSLAQPGVIVTSACGYADGSLDQVTIAYKQSKYSAVAPFVYNGTRLVGLPH